MRFVFSLLLLSINLLGVQAQEIISLDCKSTEGSFKYLHGFLHGEVNLEKYPASIDLITEANFKFWRNNNAFDNHILADSLEFNTTIVISDLYARSLGGYEFAEPWTNFTEYRDYAKSLFQSSIENNISPDFWDVWNEPQSAEFWKGSFTDLIETFIATRNTANEVDTSIQLVGPSIVSYDENFLINFLDSLSAAGITLDAVSWHEFSLPDSLSVHVSRFKNLLSENPQWGKPEIHINEYSPSQTNQIPAWKVGWFYHLEKSEVDWANNACWDDMYDGVTNWNNCIYGLNGILYYDEKSTLPTYWVHRAYGNMRGNKIFSEGSDSKSIALAGIHDDTISILTARYYSIKTGQFIFSEDSTKSIADVSLIIRNHPYPLGSKQFIKIDKIPKGDLISMHLPMDNPITIKRDSFLISSDSIIIDLPDYLDGDSYYIELYPLIISQVEEPEEKNLMPQVFPNPASSVLQLRYPPDDDWFVTLMSSNGNITHSLSNSPTEINISELTKGLYFAIIHNRAGVKYFKKFIKL